MIKNDFTLHGNQFLPNWQTDFEFFLLRLEQIWKNLAAIDFTTKKIIDLTLLSLNLPKYVDFYLPIRKTHNGK